MFKVLGIWDVAEKGDDAGLDGGEGFEVFCAREGGGEGGEFVL